MASICFGIICLKLIYESDWGHPSFCAPSATFTGSLWHLKLSESPSPASSPLRPFLHFAFWGSISYYLKAQVAQAGLNSLWSWSCLELLTLVPLPPRSWYNILFHHPQAHPQIYCVGENMQEEFYLFLIYMHACVSMGIDVPPTPQSPGVLDVPGVTWCGWWDLNLGPLGKQCRCLRAKLSLQSQSSFSNQIKKKKT